MQNKPVRPPVGGRVRGEYDHSHRVLGLRFGEIDPETIVAAALAKLSAIRAANGSELEVRRAVEAVIVHARDCLLEKAYGLRLSELLATRRSLAVRGAFIADQAAYEGSSHQE